MRSLQKSGIPGSLLLILGFISLAGCASSSKILFDYDRGADFGSYRTYNFMEGAGPNTGDYQSFFHALHDRCNHDRNGEMRLHEVG